MSKSALSRWIPLESNPEVNEYTPLIYILLTDCQSIQVLNSVRFGSWWFPANWLSDSGRRQPALLLQRRSSKISMDLILRHVDTHSLVTNNNTGMAVAGHGVTACPCCHSTVSHHGRFRKQEGRRGSKNCQGRAAWDWSYHLLDQANGTTACSILM